MLHDLANPRTVLAMHTTELSWQTWTDSSGVIGEIAHDTTQLRTYFRAGEHGLAVFPWGKFGEDGRTEGHSRAIAWGQSSRSIHADDEAAVAENLRWYAGALVCEHLIPRVIECDECEAAKLEELTAEALAEYQVIRLDIGVNATNARAVNPVDDELGEKLSQLCAEYDSAKAAADAAAERLDAVKAGIKATAALLRPGADKVRIVSDDLEHDLTVVRGVRRSLDTKLIKRLAEQAGIRYESLTKATPTTTLKAVK